MPWPPLWLLNPPALPSADRHPGQPERGAQRGVQIVNTVLPSSFPALTHTATNFAKARLEKYYAIQNKVIFQFYNNVKKSVTDIKK